MLVASNLIRPRNVIFPLLLVFHTGKKTFDKQMALQMIHFSLPDLADVHQQGHKQAFKSAHTPVLISNEALEE